MKNNPLMTIGKLSKLTNVNIKSLRYYEKIGILPPSYVNSETGYRYYSHNHIYMVQAIRLFAELNIPLQQLKGFVSSDGSQIHISQLVNYATATLEKHLEKLQQDLADLKMIQQEIQEVDALRQQEEAQYLTVPASDYWVVSFNGTIFQTDYYERFTEEQKKIKNANLEALDECDNPFMVVR